MELIVEGQPVSVAPPGVPDFPAVYRTHNAFVWRTLRRLGVNEADVPDATQEAFLVVHRRLPDFEQRSSLNTWLFGICLRVASDWRNKAHVRRETLVDAAPERANSGETAIREIALKQARSKLDAGLDLLEADPRAVFVLFEMEQLPMSEVASTIGIPLQTAYSRLYSARKVLEGWIATQQADGGMPR